jgi:hypothetical protein
MDRTTNNKTNIGAFVLGILLFVLGVLMLLSRAGVLSLNFGKIIGLVALFIGAIEAVSGFSILNRNKLVWGSTLFLSGLLLLLVSYDFVPGSWDQIWPVALIIPGLSFLMLFFSNVKESRLLVIAALLVAVGCVGMLVVNGNLTFSDRIFGSLRFFVPVAVVLAGFYLLWRNFHKAGP